MVKEPNTQLYKLIANSKQKVRNSMDRYLKRLGIVSLNQEIHLERA